MGNFNLMDIMNDASKLGGGIEEKYEFRRLPVDMLEPDPRNREVYSVERIEELADAIELAGGVLHTLVVQPKGEDGKHMIISGERRWTACKLLAERGAGEKFRKVPCLIQWEEDKDVLQLMQLLTNSTARQLTDAEKMRQAEHMKSVLDRMKGRGELNGNVREIIGRMLSVSNGQLARYHAISQNLTHEGLKRAFELGKLGVSAAYEASRLNEEGQQQIADKLRSGGEVSLKDVTAAREEQLDKEWQEKLRKVEQHRQSDASGTSAGEAEGAGAEPDALSESDSQPDTETDTAAERRAEYDDEVIAWVQLKVEAMEIVIKQLGYVKKYLKDVVGVRTSSSNPDTRRTAPKYAEAVKYVNHVISLVKRELADMKGQDLFEGMAQQAETVEAERGVPEADETGDGFPVIKNYEPHIKKKYKTTLVIYYIEQDGSFYSSFEFEINGRDYRSYGSYPDPKTDKPYATSQAAIEAAMKEAAQKDAHVHQALWGSGFAIVGEPEKAKTAIEKPKSKEECYKSINGTEEGKRITEKINKFGVGSLTPCEACTNGTRCANCCRECPAEDCGLHQPCRAFPA